MIQFVRQAVQLRQNVVAFRHAISLKNNSPLRGLIPV
jgi:hypothetical protein